MDQRDLQIIESHNWLNLIGSMVTAPFPSLIIVPAVYLWWQEKTLLGQPSEERRLVASNANPSIFEGA